jgi:hypothetical protein
MSSYLNYNFYNGGSPEPNIIDLNLTNKLVNYFKNIKIGTIIKNYTIPNTIGLPNQVLAVDTLGTNLKWNDIGTGGTGCGDIYNGGQSGPVLIGSNDSQFSIGFDNNHINLIGGLNFQHDIISFSNPTEFNLTDKYYFVELTDNVLSVKLPSVVLSSGRSYIISNKSLQNNIHIIPNGTDTIDGKSFLNLSVKNTRIQIISNGESMWFLI